MKNRKIILLLIVVIILTTNYSCSNDDNPSNPDNIDNKTITPTFTNSKILDGKEIKNIIKTNDGGYICINFSKDYNVIKYDIDFNIIWNKTYGGSDDDIAESIIQTNDGGYLVTGYSKSNDGVVNHNNGGYDIWVCKLSSTGELLWNKSYGGTGDEGINKENSVLETTNGSFYIIGHTSSNNGNISENNGGYDAWLIKINSSGQIEFEKTYGGTGDDFGRKIIQIGSKYAITVTANSTNGIFNESRGNWVVQIDESGEILWKKNLLGTNSGYINSTSNDEIVVVNTSLSEFLLSKLDNNGNVINNNVISFQSISNKQPSANKIIETEDGGFIIIGDLGNGNDQDCILFRTSASLNLKYEKIIAGNDYDKSISIFSNGSNSFFYQIVTSSNDIQNIPHTQWICSAIIKLEELIE
tara:strand:+ start:940 stop:2178 length:1239 start_codon:yes stop_codon:yes gene_type:complete